MGNRAQSEKTLFNWRRSCLEHLPEEVTKKYDPSRLSALILEAVHSMVDSEAYQVLRAAGDDSPTLAPHNMAAPIKDALSQLAETNPAAESWFINFSANQAPDAEGVHHPGQIVELVKRELADREFNPRNWKHFAKSEPAQAAGIIRTCEKRVNRIDWLAAESGSAQLLNLAALTGAHPHHTVLTGVLVSVDGLDDISGCLTGRAVGALTDPSRRFLTALFRESERLWKERPGDEEAHTALIE